MKSSFIETSEFCPYSQFLARLLENLGSLFNTLSGVHLIIWFTYNFTTRGRRIGLALDFLRNSLYTVTNNHAFNFTRHSHVLPVIPAKAGIQEKGLG